MELRHKLGQHGLMPKAKLLLVAFCLISALLPRTVLCERLSDELASVVARYGKDDVGISVVDLNSGVSVFERNAHRALAPASIQKVVTAGAAMKYLGPEYTFKTEVWGDGGSGGRLERAYIVGGGDPVVTVEALWLLARRFRMAGYATIHELVLDPSKFVSNKDRVGQRAYETGASALTFDFNSVGFSICPTKPGQSARVQIDPWEAPFSLKGRIETTSNSADVFSVDDRGDGSYLVGGKIGANRGCQQIYRSVADPVEYFGRTFKEMAAEIGLSVGKVTLGEPRSTSSLLFVQPSKPLRSIVEDMNHYSNNFIAEQILFALGADQSGRFDRELGLEKLRGYVAGILGANDESAFFDASGLDRNNRMSAHLVTSVLRAASQEESTGVEFVSSFSVSQRNGTLRERDFENGTFVRGKTGTLNGVSSLAGFVRSRGGRQFAFAIIQNGALPKNRVVDVENEIVRTLYSSQQ